MANISGDQFRHQDCLHVFMNERQAPQCQEVCDFAETVLTVVELKIHIPAEPQTSPGTSCCWPAVLTHPLGKINGMPSVLHSLEGSYNKRFKLPKLR